MTGLGAIRSAGGLAFCACLLGLACAGPRTALVVAVASDLAIPTEITEVRATVGAAHCTGGASCEVVFPLAQSSDLPLSFGIEPGASVSAPVELEIVARDASGATVVSRSVSTGFVVGRTRVLVVRLDRACVGHGACSAGETCIAGLCASASVDPATLLPDMPGHELDGLRDAGPRPDASVDDASADVGVRDGDFFDTGPVDANAPDGGDAGAPDPTSCRGRVASAPSGVARIDPDGPGGAAPFDAWCENQLDGGGWTLLAKVTGSSTLLGYDGVAWLGDPRAAFGSIDATPTDALLTPYWAVPVTELRVGDGTTWMVTTITGAATTLRAAMDVPGGVPLGATVASWAGITTLLPGPIGCSRSAIGATLATSATTVRVRIGVVGAVTSDCSDPTIWIGCGASTTTSDIGCIAFPDASGAARVCGTPGQRRARPATLLVYGR